MSRSTDTSFKRNRPNRRTGSHTRERLTETDGSLVLDTNSRTKKASTRERKASRSELRQAERVRKQNRIRKELQEKNRQRIIEGKKPKKDPTAIKPSIWEKIAEDKVYYQLRQMGDSTKNIDKWQKKRVLTSLFIFLLVGGVGARLIHPWLLLGGIIASFLFYKMQAKRVDNFFKGWKFERQLNFSKFTRLVIPYLKASGGNMALYTIFNKILRRLDNEADRRSLYQLMGEMGDNPTDIQPFLDFAERSSGTDMSYLFMSTIFDFQQSTFDTQVIDELGKMASEDMMNAIDEIIEFKLKRFVMFPTKVVMSSFILVVGLGVGLMLYNFKGLDFNPSMMSPEQQVQDAEQDMKGGSDGSEADTETTESQEIQEAESNDSASNQETTESTGSVAVNLSNGKGTEACRASGGVIGNINKEDGRMLYHTPDSPSYNLTLIDEPNEGCFDSVDDAKKAGFEPAYDGEHG